MSHDIAAEDVDVGGQGDRTMQKGGFVEDTRGENFGDFGCGTDTDRRDSEGLHVSIGQTDTDSAACNGKEAETTMTEPARLDLVLPDHHCEVITDMEDMWFRHSDEKCKSLNSHCEKVVLPSSEKDSFEYLDSRPVVQKYCDQSQDCVAEQQLNTSDCLCEMDKEKDPTLSELNDNNGATFNSQIHSGCVPLFKRTGQDGESSEVCPQGAETESNYQENDLPVLASLKESSLTDFSSASSQQIGSEAVIIAHDESENYSKLLFCTTTVQEELGSALGQTGDNTSSDLDEPEEGLASSQSICSDRPVSPENSVPTGLTLTRSSGEVSGDADVSESSQSPQKIELSITDDLPGPNSQPVKNMCSWSVPLPFDKLQAIRLSPSQCSDKITVPLTTDTCSENPCSDTSGMSPDTTVPCGESEAVAEITATKHGATFISQSTGTCSSTLTGGTCTDDGADDVSSNSPMSNDSQSQCWEAGPVELDTSEHVLAPVPDITQCTGEMTLATDSVDESEVTPARCDKSLSLDTDEQKECESIQMQRKAALPTEVDMRSEVSPAECVEKVLPDPAVHLCEQPERTHFSDHGVSLVSEVPEYKTSDLTLTENIKTLAELDDDSKTSEDSIASAKAELDVKQCDFNGLLDDGLPGESGTSRDDAEMAELDVSTSGSLEPAPVTTGSQGLTSTCKTAPGARSKAAKRRKKQQQKLNKLLPNPCSANSKKPSKFAQSFQELKRRRGDVDPASVHVDPSLTCPVCLDLYYQPHGCKPCGHIFCDPCLRKLASQGSEGVLCPLCRAVIHTCQYDPDLDLEMITHHPEVYSSRDRVERHSRVRHYPLPFTPTPPLSERLLRHLVINRGNVTDSSWLSQTWVMVWLRLLLCLAVGMAASTLLVYMYSDKESLEANDAATDTNRTFLTLLLGLVFTYIAYKIVGAYRLVRPHR